MADHELSGNPAVEGRILVIRDVYVLLDRDLAELYDVETKALNQAVKRNILRFPDTFRFQLNAQEHLELVTNCDRFGTLKHSKNPPFAYTEQGVAMLSTVLRSERAIHVSIHIMEAFVMFRRFAVYNERLFGQIQHLQRQHYQLIKSTDERFERVFQNIQARQLDPSSGIFFDGQIFDAHAFVSNLIRSASRSIRLVDNYIDDTVFTLLTKRGAGVSAKLYVGKLGPSLQIDLDKHNAQYPRIEIVRVQHIHDRFLIIDDAQVYHLGASIKDLGRQLFAFSRMDGQLNSILTKLSR